MLTQLAFLALALQSHFSATYLMHGVDIAAILGTGVPITLR